MRPLISPQLLGELAADQGPLARRLDPKTPGAAPAKIELDEKTFRWMINEDAMATEKLAEGIRQFAKDLRALRDLVAKAGGGLSRPTPPSDSRRRA